jgi:hypothetical protein
MSTNAGHANLRPLKKGDPRTIELARKGGQVTAAQTRKAKKPYAGSLLDLMDAVGMTGPSWRAWRAVWRLSLALPDDGLSIQTLNEDARFYREHTGRNAPPSSAVDELWMAAGRRGGKSRMAALLSCWLCMRHDEFSLAPGEVGLVPLLATNLRQAAISYKYVEALAQHPTVSPYVHNRIPSKLTVEFRTLATVEAMVASYRGLRGHTFLACIADEIAFWRDGESDNSTNPDSAILEAIRPALVPGGLLFAISSPYAQRGELYETYQRYFGTEDAHTLVWNASTLALHPTYPRHKIDREFEKDPISAASEYGADGLVRFRTDVEQYITVEALNACVVPGRLELAPVSGVKFVGFVDPAGGSGKDSYTIAIVHLDASGRACLDAVRERRPPFSPEQTTAEFADLLHSYRITSVTGDRYAGEWPREAFHKHGIRDEPSQLTKSELYDELVAPINSGTRIELLDNAVLRQQLLGLERRTARGGRDSVDHAAGGKDDVANAVADCIVCCLPASSKRKVIQFA